jgi:hypothetical protein
MILRFVCVLFILLHFFSYIFRIIIIIIIIYSF